MGSTLARVWSTSPAASFVGLNLFLLGAYRFLQVGISIPVAIGANILCFVMFWLLSARTERQPKPVDSVGKSRFLGLDACRGMAALLVVLFHGSIFLNSSTTFFRDYVDVGVVGVSCFFIISGFVIPISFERRTSFRSFLLGRWFRLFPLYFISAVIAVTLIAIFRFRIEETGGLSLKLWFLSNLTMVHSFFGTKSLLLSYWTLAYEWLFYIFGGLLYFSGARKFSVYLLATLTVMMVGLVLRFALTDNSFAIFRIANVGFFAVGHTLYLVKTNQLSSRLGWMLIALFGLALTISQIVLFQSKGLGNPHLKELLSWLLGFGLFTLTLEYQDRIQWPKAVIYLGTVSYSLYLFHPLFLDAPIFHGPIGYVAFLAISLLSAAAIHTYIESPITKYGALVVKRYESGETRSEPVTVS